MKKKLEVVDLFSGCGGMTQGFQDAGFEVVHAIENWPAAIKVYRDNFSHPVSQLDMAQQLNEVVDIVQAIKPDVIIGGPPCQDFSSAGKRVEGQRADLTWRFSDIITQSRPEWFVMENVERIKDSSILSDIQQKLRSAGYSLSSNVLNAAFCGVPQNRKRFFMVGRLDGTEDGELESVYEHMMSKNPMTVRQYFGSELPLKHYYRHPRSYARRGIFSVDEPSPTVRGVNRPLPPLYRLHPGDPEGVDLAQVRSLTERERARVQTFPANFLFSGSKTDVNQMVGNAVPVQLAAFVASAISVLTEKAS